jgi:DNA-binding response OmpR family regulator
MKRVLLVDDDHDARESLALLIGDSHEVIPASSGAEAVFIASTESFDVLLLDLHMPILSGAGVLEELRTRGIRIPTLLVSASIDLPRVAASLGLDYLSKPYSMEALAGKLDRLASAREPSSVIATRPSLSNRAFGSKSTPRG